MLLFLEESEGAEEHELNVIQPSWRGSEYQRGLMILDEHQRSKNPEAARLRYTRRLVTVGQDLPAAVRALPRSAIQHVVRESLLAPVPPVPPVPPPAPPSAIPLVPVSVPVAAASHAQGADEIMLPGLEFNYLPLQLDASLM